MKKIPYIVISLMALHLFLLFNLRFTAWPEMLSYPYLLNNGFVLYKDFIHPYPPLLTELLAVIYKTFGYQLRVLEIVTWTIILASDLFLYVIIKRLAKEKLALLGLLIYVFLQPALEGNMLWFDVAIVVPLLITTYFLVLPHEDKNLFFVGIALSVAVMVKQTAGLFLVVALFYFLFSKTKIKKIAWFLAVPILGGALLSIELLKNGVLNDFINWVFIYPLTVWSKFPGYVQMALSKEQIATISLLIFPLAILFFKSGLDIVKDKKFLLLGPFLLVALIGIYPRFSFFHFQPALAFIVILTFYLINRAKVPVIISSLCFLVLALLIAVPIFARDWGRETRFWGKEDIDLTETISENVSENEKVFLLGPQSGLYAMTNRLPPKPWADNFGWYLEIPGVQKEIISRWDVNKPKYIFWAEPMKGNWFDLGTYQPKLITSWINKNYTKEKELQKGIWLWQRKE